MADRVVVYPSAVPRALDILKTGQNDMVGLAKLSEAVLGTAIAINGFAVTQTTPSSTSVIVGPGQVYSLQQLESSAISSLNIDAHSIVKQGIINDPTTVTLVPPTTPGYSINVLIEVQYLEADTDPVLLNYYNAANPSVPLTGPGGNGQQQNTRRAGTVSIQTKYGVPAASGSQATPAPDAGWAGAAVVTIAYAQSSITSGNITTYTPGPFIPVTLPGVPAAIQGNGWVYAPDSGTTNALAATLKGVFFTTLADGMQCEVKVANTNTSASTLTLNGISAPIVRNDGSYLQPGDLPIGFWAQFRYNGVAANWRLLNIPFPSIRTNLTTNLTVYVRTDGNDLNNGLSNTSSGAFATIQGAWTKLCSLYSFAGYTITIKLGIAGTYAGCSFNNLGVSGYVIVLGDTAAPNSYIVTPIVSGTLHTVFSSQVATVQFTGCVADMSSVSNGFAIWSNAGGNITLGPALIVKNNTTSSSVGLFCIDGGGSMSVAGTVTIQGNGTGTVNSVFNLNAGGSFLGSSVSTTMTVNGISYAAFCFCQAGNAYWQNITFSATTVSGSRYSVVLNGTINTLGSGANYFPGTTAGSTATGGQYA